MVKPSTCHFTAISLRFFGVDFSIAPPMVPSDDRKTIVMANVPSNAQTARNALAVMFMFCLSAKAAFYINCASCHTALQNGMAIANFQTTTNLGEGLHKVFKASPGQTVVIRLNVTNNYGGNYALNMNNLGARGVHDSRHQMDCTADFTWTSYFPGTATNFFMAGCATASPKPWTFNLVVKSNTPADFYLIKSQMAGYTSSDLRWSQQESFYIQVANVAPPAP